MKEIWKPIPGYEGYYEASSLGRIRSVCRFVNAKYGKRLHKGRILILFPDRDGYLKTSVCKNNIAKSAFVHRLIAETFLENPLGLPVINHKNEIKTDNRVENLEFCSIQYNNTYNGRMQRIANKKKKPITQLSLEGKPLKTWDCPGSASSELGINRSNIVEVLHGHRHKAGGYRWEYVNEINLTK